MTRSGGVLPIKSIMGMNSSKPIENKADSPVISKLKISHDVFRVDANKIDSGGEFANGIGYPLKTKAIRQVDQNFGYHMTRHRCI